MASLALAITTARTQIGVECYRVNLIALKHFLPNLRRVEAADWYHLVVALTPVSELVTDKFAIPVLRGDFDVALAAKARKMVLPMIDAWLDDKLGPARLLCR